MRSSNGRRWRTPVDAERFELITGHKSKRNIHIYEKLGYRTRSKREVAPGIYLVFMVKNVKERAAYEPSDETARATWAIRLLAAHIRKRWSRPFLLRYARAR